MDIPRTEPALCHSCGNRWAKYPSDDLQCPVCHSEFVEIVEPHSDEAFPFPPDDPEEQHIHDFGHGFDHMHGSNYRRPDRDPAQYDAQPPWNILNSFMSMLGDMAPSQQQAGGNNTYRSPTGFHFQATIPGGSRFAYYSSSSSSGSAGRQTNDEELEGLMDTLFLGPSLRPMPPHGLRGDPGDGQPMPNPFARMLFQLLDPAHARAGDAVFSQEALDRVISEMMDNSQMNNAPGPANESSIRQIPKVKLTRSMIGEDGKDVGSCSICMEDTPVGEEVTRLWCSHWFHESCIKPWLEQHDTCPQCRKGLDQSRAEAEGRDKPGSGGGNQKPPSSYNNNGGDGAGGAGPSFGGQNNRMNFSSGGHGYDQRPMPGSFYSTSWRSSAPPVPFQSRPNIRRSSTTGSSSRYDSYIVSSGSRDPTRPHQSSRQSSHRSQNRSHEIPRSERRSSHHSQSSHHNPSSHHRSHRNESRHVTPPAPEHSSGGFRETLRSLWSGGNR